MSMTREEHKNIVNQILAMATPENQASMSGLLTQLTDDYEETLTSNETLTTTNATLTANNEQLRKVNTDLFLKVGHSSTNKNDPKNNPSNGGESEIPEMKFEDLFDEKGGLK